MERNGASHRITQHLPVEAPPQGRTMRPANQWTNGGDRLFSNEDALALSVSRHPSGGYKADVSNTSWDPEAPDTYTAGPFRTPLRAQVAAESLGQRTTDASRPSPQSYRRR